MRPRLATVCAEPGCQQPAIRRGRCQAHARELERPWEARRTARGRLHGSAHTSWRRAALERAGHACQRCGARPGDALLEVHHRGELADHADVVVLCRSCDVDTFGIATVET
jgi:hypothetical protein